MWQQNLLSNLLVIGILLALFIIIYCKVKDITFPEFFRQVKEVVSPNE